MTPPQSSTRESSQVVAATSKRSDRKRSREKSGQDSGGEDSDTKRQRRTSGRRTPPPSLRISIDRNKVEKAEELSRSSAKDSGEENGNVAVKSNRNTRAMNGIRKERKRFIESEGEITEELPKEEEDTGISIDSAAFILAEIDKHAYQRELVRDAHSVLANVVMPSSFPWNGPVMMYPRNIARDIDEYVPITTIDDYHEPGDFRKASGSPHRRSKKKGAALHFTSHRSDEDAGIVKLTTQYPLSFAKREQLSVLPIESSGPLQKDLPGEIGLDLYRRSIARTQGEQKFINQNAQTMRISLNLNGSSTRSSLFEKEPRDTIPLLLPALLPQEVQEGRSIKGAMVDKVTEELGSYDLRHGFAAPSRNSDRVRVGRVRKMWTIKQGKKQRPEYRSLVTNERLENNQHLRPRKVALGIRFQGELLGSHRDDDAVQKAYAEVHKWKRDLSEGGIDDNGNDLYSSKVVKSALRVAMSRSSDEETSAEMKVRYSFEPYVFQHIYENTIHTAIDNLRDTYKQNLAVVGTTKVRVTPPKIECVPVDNNYLHVVCSESGNLPEKNDCSLLVQEFCNRHVCSVCFRNTGEELTRCADCNIPVHKNCYGPLFDEGIDGEKWFCQQCDLAREDDYSRTRWCELCGHLAGTSMITDPSDSKKLVHTTCNIWCDQPGVKRKCSFCSSDRAKVVCCAANDCSIAFHPYCGAISSILATRKMELDVAEKNSGADATTCSQLVEEERKKDTFLCTQNTLTMMKVDFVHNRVSSSATVPVVFCGYHNPSRRVDLRGLHPDGCCLQSSFAIALRAQYTSDKPQEEEEDEESIDVEEA